MLTPDVFFDFQWPYWWTVSLHQYGASKALQRFVKYFGKKLRNCGHKGLGFGQTVYVLVFYNISFCWLPLLDGVQFIFLCAVFIACPDCVTAKTKNAYQFFFFF